MNSRLCEPATTITPRSDISCQAHSVHPLKALFTDRRSTEGCGGSGTGCNDFFMCAAFQTKAQSAVTHDEETVNVKRCWKDGSDQVLSAKCICYNNAECDFEEVGGPPSDSGSRQLFKEGCLVEFCLPDGGFSSSVVAGTR